MIRKARTAVGVVWKRRRRLVVCCVYVCVVLAALYGYRSSLRHQSATLQQRSTNTDGTLRDAANSPPKISRHPTLEELTEQQRAELATLLVPAVHVPEVDCGAAVRKDRKAIEHAEKVQNATHKTVVPPDEYVRRLSNCSHFLTERRYRLSGLSREEQDFPLAYTILFYRDFEQLERLLRAIYRPQNQYCLHLDRKSSRLLPAARALVACFPNVFLAPQQVSVTWGRFSVLQPEFLCMEALIHRPGWRYYINLTGQDFPLQTNADLVRTLTTFRGAAHTKAIHSRRKIIYRLKKKSSPPPAGITVLKGEVHVLVPRAFVQYVLYNSTARAFRDWVHDTWIPDETFYPSLIHSPQAGVPGAYKGFAQTSPQSYPFLARYKKKSPNHCRGFLLRGVCNYGPGDLPYLTTSRALFANKFDLQRSHLGLACMEEWFYNRTRQEAALGHSQLDPVYYEQLEFTRNHV